ncbi:MAG: hypothetical protein COA79_09090 [Planctomycetota bacterium]|nr:MAG: hypothetical protein COA79_09090 [Planctomycetota bacterium]
MNLDEKLVDMWQNDRNAYYKELKTQLKKQPNEVFESILLIINMFKHSDLSHVFKYLGKVSLEKHSKVQCIFFYLHWLMADTQTYRLKEASIILSKMEEYIDDSTPKALKAEFELKGNARDGEENLENFKKSLSLIPIDSQQYKINLKNLTDSYASGGELHKLELSYLQRLEPEYRNLFLFIDAMERGDTDKALELIDDVMNTMLKLPDPVKLKLNFLKGLLNLYLRQSVVDESFYLLISINSLLNHDPEKALEYAKKFHNHPGKQISVLTNFTRWHLIRTELANKNLSAALRLIGLEKNFSKMNFSSLFYARIELLRGNKEKAILQFANALKLSKDINAMGRFDFELDLATDLTPGKIRFLTEGATKLLAENRINKVKAPVNNVSNVEEKGVEKLKGKSIAIKAVKDEVLKYAPFDIPVLILGETGVGKDVIANAIHEESKRKDEPFIAINCSAIAESLLQSELFGYEAGAYTGAIKTHKGIFEEAGQGTVFLDEIGDISSGLQAVLLRILESGEFRPVGSAKPRPAHCRIIAATNASLEARVDEGTFRKDLMYRLKRLVINVPPLRERPVDITYLAEYYANLNRVSSDPVTFSDEFKQALQAHTWPGNVRELKNEIEKIRLLNSDKPNYTIEQADFLQEKTTDLEKDSPQENVAEPSVEIPKKEDVTQPDQLKRKKSTKEILQNSGSYFRRLEYIKELFTEHKRLTRKEICQITEVSNITIGRDLKKLREEKFIIKMEPTKSARTHYFVLNES